MTEHQAGQQTTPASDALSAANLDMSGKALWVILYDLALEGRETYLDWYHDIHIPEKLARPGYTWAAHYQVVSPSGTPVSLSGNANEPDGNLGYIGLFAGDDTSVFLNPSPAQIAPRRDATTRTMHDLRNSAQSFVASEEWHVESTDNGGRRRHPAIELIGCNVGDNDQDFGAWCVQEMKPVLKQTPGFQRTTKMLTAFGPVKHAIMSEFSSLAAVPDHSGAAPSTDWTQRVNGYRQLVTSAPLIGARIWPAS